VFTIKKLVFLVSIVLFCINVFSISYGGESTLETRLTQELTRIKGVKMAQVSLTLEGKDITEAQVDIRSQSGYKFTKEQKTVIIDFIAYSAPGLIPENIKLNISNEPLISFPTNSVPYISTSIEEQIATKVKGKLPVEEIYINYINPGKNFLGEYKIKPRVAVIVKIIPGKELREKAIFDLVDALCKTVKDLSIENILIIDTDAHNIFQLIN